MKPVLALAFKIQAHKSAFHGELIYIDESLLLPPRYFSPEEKKSIAAIHAYHIQEYANKGLIMPNIIVLNVGVRSIGSLGSIIQTTTSFEKDNGGTIDVQTIFSPFDGTDKNIIDNMSHSMRLIRFNGNTYEA